jgi:HEPN domain-containing protein
MDEADLELVKDWLTRAHQNLRAALILAAAEEAPLDVAIYHCQQAGEKAVKAYLQWRDEPFAKTHNLRALVIQAATLDRVLMRLKSPLKFSRLTSPRFATPAARTNPCPSEKSLTKLCNTRKPFTILC